MTRRPLGLLDTSTYLLLAEIEDVLALPELALISTVTLAELTVGPTVTDDPAERVRRQGQVQEAEASFDPVPFDRDAARAFGHVAASFRQAGRRPSARSLEAMIAAIAFSRRLPLHTCHASDFECVAGLDVVPVPHPRQGLR